MTSNERSASTGIFFSYIASAANNILYNLKLSYINLKKSVRNKLSKISKKSKDAKKHLQTYMLYSKFASILGRAAVKKSSLDPKTAINHEQIQIETLSVVFQGNDIYHKAAETSY
jgi:hypothetical protein